jgi:hypothetical protein
MSTREETPNQLQESAGCSLSASAGSALYFRLMASDVADSLMHKAWDGWPWMVDAITDSVNSMRWHEVMCWCHEQFGPEAWPLHDKPGDWHTGCATVYGKTWIGFTTEEMMTRFIDWQNS